MAVSLSNWWFHWIVAPCGALLASCACTYLLIYLAPLLGYQDHPDAHKRHTIPTPLLGGVAVFAGGLFGATILNTTSDFAHPLSILAPVAIMSVLALIVGLVDDLVQLKPLVKLGVLIAAAAVAGVYVVLIDGLSIAHSLVLVCCLIFFANAFNLLDNADGLCSSVGIAVLLSARIHTNDPLPFVAACGAAGFLVWNWPKARIFLGDTGSLLIGVWCVMLGLAGRAAGGDPIAWKMLPVFWVPIYDTCSVIVVRIRAGRSVFQGGQDHFSHRLMRRGVSNSSVNLLLGGATLLAGLMSVFLSPCSSALSLVVLLLVAALWELYAARKGS